MDGIPQGQVFERVPCPFEVHAGDSQTPAASEAEGVNMARVLRFAGLVPDARGPSIEGLSPWVGFPPSADSTPGAWGPRKKFGFKVRHQAAWKFGQYLTWDEVNKLLDCPPIRKKKYLV